MTALALVTGKLFGPPKHCTSKTGGKPFTSCTVQTRDGTESVFWKVLIFNEDAQSELTMIDDGDAVSARGTFKAEVYVPATGEARVNLTLFADSILPLTRRKSASKPRKASRARSAAPASSGPPMAPGWSDEIPFVFALALFLVPIMERIA